MKDYPFIKLTLAFVIGILSLPLIKINVIYLVVITLITIILFTYSIRKKEFDKYQFVITFFFFAVFIGIGNNLVQLNKKHFNSNVTGLYREKDVTITGDIERIELFREKEILFYVKTDKFIYGETIIKDNIKLLCRLRVDQSGLKRFYNSVKPGNKIELKGTYSKGRERRNPGEFDYDRYLKSKGITGIFTVNKISDYHIIDHSTDVFENSIFQARKYIDQKIVSLHSNETSALLRGLLLADRREIDQETKTQFINSGVIHVLAVSGLHVGFIAFIFFFMFGRFNLYLRSLLTITGLICFMFLTGVPPSVCRATLMAVVIIIAFLLNRSTNIFNSLSIAAFIILAINPEEIYSPGFQLSFSAVIAIGVLYQPLSLAVKKLRIQSKFLNYLLLFMCVSLAAQIGTIPFVLIYFGKISIIALIVNLIVIPAIGLIIALAVTTLIFSVFFPFIAAYYSAANDLLAYLLLKLIAYSGELSFSKIDIISYTLFDSIVFYIFIALLFAAFGRFKNIVAKFVLVILTIGNLFVFSSLDDHKLLPDNLLSVFMIDVGQGDSFLIKFPDGETALIDAGNTSIYFDNGERIIIPLLIYLGIDKIDYGFISHIDLDHYGGFFSLVQTGKIKSIYKPLLDSTLSKDIRFEDFLKKNSIKINNYNGQNLKIGNSRINVLSNDKIAKQRNLSSNDKSGILKLVYGNTSIIFTGDAGIKSEKLLVEKYSTFLNSDVLKVGHHGSKTSSSDEFIDYVSPRFALISAGIQNKFNHPSTEIISKLSSRGINLLRTDKYGGTLLVSDGKNINIKKWN